MVQEDGKMWRVAFVLNPDVQWLGGANLLRNLVGILQDLPEKPIEPVMLAPPEGVNRVREMVPHCEVLGCSWLRRRKVIPALNRRLVRRLERNPLLDRFLARHGIDVLSHAGFLGRGSAVGSIGWIPDFQHRFLPHLFSSGELARRDSYYSQLARLCDAVILSSETARGHFAEIFPDQVDKTHLLRFAVTAPPLDSLPMRQDLEVRHSFNGPYFFLPNQFWSHKNHVLVARALSILRARGRPVTVLASGSMWDNRGTSHIEELRAVIDEGGIEDDLRLLGVVPYPDLMGLLRHSMGLINPSLFEGWSTTVEEGKAMGKTLILSDIPVHREQASPRARFVPPDDPEAMADTLMQIAEDFDPAADECHLKEAVDANGKSISAYGRSYADIVSRVIEQRRNSRADF